MNIILGKSDANKLNDKYIVLELDTVTIKNSTPIVAYCVVENMPLTEMPQAADLKMIHASLMPAYRNREWKYCEQAIAKLTGCWGGDLDTFYDSLLTRVRAYKANEPGPDWTGVIPKG